MTDVLATTIRRADIEKAMRVEGGPADLVLELVRASEGEKEHRSVAIAWESAELERLLRESADEEILVGFDLVTLARAFDDVEAHGMRETALVLSAAAAAAAVGAGQAPAHVGEGTGPGGTPLHYVAPAESPADGEGGVGLPAPGPAETAALSGAAAALAIAGAAFVARSRRRVRPS